MAERLLSKKEVNQAHLLWWLAAETNNSYERLQAPSFCSAVAKNLKKIYGDDTEGYKDALKRHLEFYNTEGTIGAVVVGIVLAMEEEKVKGHLTGDVITGIKLGLMGPIAGIGDTLIWGMIKSILMGIACNFALQGSPIALVFPPLFSILIFVVGRYTCRLGYDLGSEAVPKLLQSGTMNKLITAASILGLFMMGALSASYVTVTTPLSWTIESTGAVISIQSYLDQILPGMLQLAAVFGVYWYFTHKGQNYIKLVLLILVISIVAAFFGILG
ncbi:PTS system mannose/fructose/sorbose family transporter subunit IID [uncultured Traorella sp.]|uniref:PTS system mannose/fructose/sorbose family transporter subunit IID n=1 Tax=uncultured Traorella sp. TaxID=1929048 RepID=UPI0025CB8C7A|nr:PTS system mannose/fructose/sorbose family transporter subunit IID [uncultured Traorella sp.]